MKANHLLNSLYESDELESKTKRVLDIAERFLDIIGEGYIESIWLIGSRAEGRGPKDPNVPSDWDFLVVGEDFDQVEDEKIERLENGERLYGLSLDAPIATRGESLDIIFSSTPPKAGKLVYKGQ